MHDSLAVKRVLKRSRLRGLPGGPAEGVMTRLSSRGLGRSSGHLMRGVICLNLRGRAGRWIGSCYLDAEDRSKADVQKAAAVGGFVQVDVVVEVVLADLPSCQIS